MKILIPILLLSVSTFAQKESPLSLVSHENKEQFKAALEHFELMPHQLDQKRRRRQRPPTLNLNDIIKPLNENLKGKYYSKAKEVLGECGEGDCLSQDSLGAWFFKDGAGSKHCYPGTNCEYYRCMEEKYRCLDVGVEYFANLAKPTCEAYVANIGKKKFTSKGNEWIYNVMVCLQKGLFEECSIRGNCPESESNEKTCEHITEFTLKFHPGCYINSGVGVCKLPLKDQLNIWRTVGPFLTDRERIEAYKVVRYCLFKTPIE
jgi:hypothetical protein